MGQVSEMISKDAYQSGKNDVTLVHIIALLKEGVSIDIISRTTRKSVSDIQSIKRKYNL